MPPSSSPAQSLPYFDPLVLYGTATVSPGAAASPNVSSLANPHGLPMEIYEIRFRVYPKCVLSTDFKGLTGLSIGVKLDMGAFAICDAKVPISGFGTIRDGEIAEAGAQYSQPSAEGSGSSAVAQSSAFSWRLKYPLLVPAGAVLVPVFEHLGQNPFDVVVEVLYFARTLPPDYNSPDRVMVPWVVAFNSKSYTNSVNAPSGIEVSPDDDLVNNFDVPLEITRLVGAASLQTTSVSGINNAAEDITDHRFRLGRVSVRGSRGDEIARTPTIFNTLFPTDWLAWDIPGSWIMRPGEFYKVRLLVGAVDYTPSSLDLLPNLGRVQYSVTAVGFRPIETKKLLAGAREMRP